MIPVLFGLSGPVLTADERAFFRDAEPAGFILFGRNCVAQAQVRALTDSLRDLTGRDDLAVLIDQEGGRVARMRPPEWPDFPAGAVFDRLYDVAPLTAIQAARANGQALGLMLAAAGVTVNCAPLLDVRRPETTGAIGDRSLGADPMRVAALGRALLEGMGEAGVEGVVKHMPGHGRATADTHLVLPRVTATEAELEEDIRPFAALAGTARIGMTSHVLYEAWDAERPATLSPAVVEGVIRGRIGFDGLLLTDDIDMKALPGTPAEKAAGALAAGCDLVLDCWARMEEMVAVAGAVPTMADRTRERLAAAARPAVRDPADPGEAIARRDALLALAAVEKPDACA